MDSLDLIYIRKVFSLFMYVTPKRRYCNVKSESEIFDLRNVVIVVVAWLVIGKCTVCVFDGSNQSCRVNKDVRLM